MGYEKIIMNQTITMFVILIVGFVGAKAKILNQKAIKMLSDILLYITAPMLILSSFLFEIDSEAFINAGKVFFVSLLFFSFIFFISKLVFIKYNHSEQQVLRFAIVFPNCGYMGLPILNALFGRLGVFYGTMIVVAYQISMWTLGVGLFSDYNKKKIIKNVIVSPAIIALYCGVFIFFTGIKLPISIINAFESVGNMTMPISMLIIGAIISQAKLNTLFKGFAGYYAVVLRLIIIPVTLFLILKLVGMPTFPATICLVSFSMPTGVTTVVFAEKFDKDALLASRCVIISTVLSLITIPLILKIFT